MFEKALAARALSHYGAKEKHQPLYQKLMLTMAEKPGFEPGRRLSHPTPLAGEPLRPLGYFSTEPAMIFMAEREGFEPPVPFDITGFQDQRLQPLGHLSVTSDIHYKRIRPECQVFTWLFNFELTLQGAGDVWGVRGSRWFSCAAGERVGGDGGFCARRCSALTRQGVGAHCKIVNCAPAKGCVWPDIGRHRRRCARGSGGGERRFYCGALRLITPAV